VNAATNAGAAEAAVSVTIAAIANAASQNAFGTYRPLMPQSL
jgi:hypothetical protein